MYKAADKLVACAEVVFLGSATGRFDMLGEVMVRNQDELRQFLARILKEVPGLTETESNCFLKPRAGRAPWVSAPEFSRPLTRRRKAGQA